MIHRLKYYVLQLGDPNPKPMGPCIWAGLTAFGRIARAVRMVPQALRSGQPGVVHTRARVMHTRVREEASLGAVPTLYCPCLWVLPRDVAGRRRGVGQGCGPG